MKRAVLATFALVASASLANAFEVKSSDIAPGKPVAQKFMYNSFGCTGENVSPELTWSNPPAGTKSFAVLVHDPDAPTGGAGFWHWIVLNIPASATGLPQGAGAADGKGLPHGAVQLDNDFGDASWGGPCPPPGSGPHKYHYTVYALGVEKLDAPKNAKAAVAGFMVNKNAIGKATLVVPVSR
jgi:Raf kinase inhibitor-like YbhB/YbcL family protein